MYVIGEGLGKIFTALWYFFNLFSAASWEIYKALLKLVKWVLSCPLLMSMSEAFSVISTLNKIYTKLWVTETAFGPRVESSPSETMNPAPPITSHGKLSVPAPMQETPALPLYPGHAFCSSTMSINLMSAWLSQGVPGSSWLNTIPGMSLRVFLDGINTWISRKSIAGCPPYCGWPSSNQWKTWIEQKDRSEGTSLWLF